VRLYFRDCVLDTGVRTVTRAGERLALSPKAFRLLEVLVERRPNAVSHEELRQRLWPDVQVGGTTLARLVSEVRTALGDTNENEEIIRTVHRFGYAFAATATDPDERLPETGAPRYAIRWGSQLVPLAAGENVFGRAGDVLITLPSSKVSRRHARIVISGDRAVLEDLGSRNGTYLGNRRIESAVDLKNGDRIGIGPALLIFCSGADDGVTSADSRTRTALD
jgi:DNA-binding winged helix-turn-helix (wHTH) protein